MPRRWRLHVASPQPPARHGEPAQVFPPMPWPPTGDRGWMGVSGWSRIRAGASAPWQAAPQMGDRASADSLRWNLGSGPGSAGRRHGRPARRRQQAAGAAPNGKEADRLMARIDPGVASRVAELRGHERQAAEELGQWKTHHEERKPSTGCAPGGACRVFPANASPASDDRGWMAGFAGVKKLSEGRFVPGSPRLRKRAFGPNSGHIGVSSPQASGSRHNRKTRGPPPSAARALLACRTSL
jgi:hypothetical protein